MSEPSIQSSTEASIEASIQSWAEPLDGEPAGADPRGLPAYQALRDEIAKLESPGAGPCRWEVVEREASAVLAASKDLASASFLAGALAQRRGVEGLALGTTLLATLLERFEAPYPARPRARASALAWYLERAEQIAASLGVQAADRAHLAALERALATLRRAAIDRLGDDAPSTHRLAEAVQRLVLALPPEAPAPTPNTPTPNTPTPPPPPLPLPSPPDDPHRLPQHLVQLGSALLSTARSLRASSPLDATALRLFLTALHLPVSQPPAITKPPHRTAMPAPAAALRQELERLPTDADPARAADICLRAIEKHRFWLDAHLALHHALERAPSARDAHDLHASELRALVSRLPQLLELEFTDGTPFAGDDTRAWLASLSSSAPAATASDTASPLDDALRDARDALRAGRTSDALTRAHDAVRLATTARDRFVARLEVAAIALDAKAPAVALALSAELHRDATARDLAEWDAPLAARACALYLRAAKASGDAPLPFPAAEVHARLCLLDPAMAAQLARA